MYTHFRGLYFSFWGEKRYYGMGGGGGEGGRGIKFTWEFSLNIINITLLTKQFTCLKVAEYHTHCIITKRGGESGAAGVFQEKLIPFLQV